MIAVITVAGAAEIADRLWRRDPSSFRSLCRACRSHGITLLDRIMERADQMVAQRYRSIFDLEAARSYAAYEVAP